MSKYGKELGEDSLFGVFMVETISRFVFCSSLLREKNNTIIVVCHNSFIYHFKLLLFIYFSFKILS